MAWLYKSLSAVILVVPTFDSSPVVFSCLHSDKVERNLAFIVVTTEKQRFMNQMSVLNSKENLPFLTVLLGLSCPAFNCCVARDKPELRSCNALTKRTRRSARRPNSFCG